MNLSYIGVSAHARSTVANRNIAPLIIAVLVVFSVPSHAVAAGGKTITKLPYVIKKPGVYVLAKNLTTPLTSGAAIVVNADGVTIDMKGFGIRYVPATPGVATVATGIYCEGFSHLTIRNGCVEGFSWGIRVTSDPMAVIEDITLRTTRTHGIFLMSHAAVIRRCSVLDTTNSSSVVGISALGVGVHIADCLVYNTDSSASSASCIFVIGSGSTIERNRVVNPSLNVNTTAIETMGSMHINDNHVTRANTGVIADGNSKLSRNLTTGCNLAFSGGTLVEGNN